MELIDKTKGKPVDTVASKVISKGVEYTPDKIVKTGDTDVLPPTKPIYSNKNNHDLTGIRSGHLTVIGISTERRYKGNRPLWVCRCDCGMFTFRRAKSIKKKSDFDDRCERCRHYWYQRRHDHYRRTGKDID